jgi:hypothetical protein
MKLLAVVGPGLSLLLLIIGIALIAASFKGGLVVAITGGAAVAFWLTMIPLARRKNNI